MTQAMDHIRHCRRELFVSVSALDTCDGKGHWNERRRKSAIDKLDLVEFLDIDPHGEEHVLIVHETIRPVRGKFQSHGLASNDKMSCKSAGQIKGAQVQVPVASCSMSTTRNGFFGGSTGRDPNPHCSLRSVLGGTSRPAIAEDIECSQHA